MTTATSHSLADSTPETMVRDAIARWRGGQKPDAAGFLSDHPQVRDRKSLAIDLIYEEYCLRNDLGETMVPSTFCEKFPSYRQSLQRMIDVHQFLEECPAAERGTEWQWPSPGDSFLGFQVLEQIGAGALARVYLASQPALGSRHVVIKVSRFGASEARLLGKLEHPSIVPIHSVHQDIATGVTCICMPYLGTATLIDLLDAAFAGPALPSFAEVIGKVARRYQPAGVREPESAPLDSILRNGTYVEGVILLGAQLAEGLAAAHQLGVLHRDIKPSNILLSRSGRAMLLDFNLSTDVEDSLARMGGTIAYMPPERISTLMEESFQGERKLDPRSDLFSLGAVLYELLTGNLPSRPPGILDAKQPRLDDWLQARLTPPERPQAVNPEVEASLARVVMRCLSPDVNDRPTSAAELASELRACLSLSARTGRFLRRNRRSVLAAGIGLAALTTAGGVAWALQPPYEERMYRAGVAAYQRGESQVAIDCFDKALRIEPQSARLLFARSQSYRQLGDWAAAKRDFEATYKATNDPRILPYLGYVVHKTGYDSVARGNYEKALRLGVNTAEVQHNVAYFLAAKSPHESVKAFDRALALDPGSALGWQYRAWVLYGIASPKNEPLAPEALEDIERALQLDPGDVVARHKAASLYAYAAQESPELMDRALAHLQAAIAAGDTKRQIQADRHLQPLLDRLTEAEKSAVESSPNKLLTRSYVREPSRDIALPGSGASF